MAENISKITISFDNESHVNITADIAGADKIDLVNALLCMAAAYQGGQAA